MPTINERLDQLLKAAGVVTTGIAIGRTDDKATWKVTPASLQGQAQPIIDAYTEPTPHTVLEEDAEQRLMADKRFRAILDAAWEAIPSPTMTKAQLRQRAKAIYKNGNGS